MKYLFLFLTVATLHARDWMAELRAGAFLPTSGLLRKIYGPAWIEGETEIGYFFNPHLQGWGNAGYFYKRGHSPGPHPHAHLQVYQVSAGFKYVILRSPITPYLGLGPCYTFLHFKNHPHFTLQRVYKNRWGFTAKSGLIFDLPKHFLLDFFFDYYYQRMHFRNGDLDAGGFRTGVGLGYRF